MKEATVDTVVADEVALQGTFDLVERAKESSRGVFLKPTQTTAKQHAHGGGTNCACVTPANPASTKQYSNGDLMFEYITPRE